MRDEYAHTQMTMPNIRDFTLLDSNGELFTFTGSILGHVSARKDEHYMHTCECGYKPHSLRARDGHREHYPDHRELPYAKKGEKCSACRWFEVSIYRVDHEGPTTDVSQPSEEPSYLVYKTGGSIVSRETPRVTTLYTTSPHQVVEFLVLRHAHHEPELPKPSALVLAQAAQFDPGIEYAFLNRSVK